MRILIVDDDSLAGEIAAAILEETGHECLLAENGVEALEKLDEEPAIELVVSDLNTPLLSVGHVPALPVPSVVAVSTRRKS